MNGDIGAVHTNFGRTDLDIARPALLRLPKRILLTTPLSLVTVTPVVLLLLVGVAAGRAVLRLDLLLLGAGEVLVGLGILIVLLLLLGAITNEDLHLPVRIDGEQAPLIFEQHGLIALLALSFAIPRGLPVI